MPKGIHIAYFAGGCFWGIEKKMNELNGIINTTVGYMGGKIKNPTYKQVSTGKTGYVETVRVSYQKKKLSYKDLLIYFLKIHDPTSFDKQGPDTGPVFSKGMRSYFEETKLIILEVSNPNSCAIVNIRFEKEKL